MANFLNSTKVNTAITDNTKLDLSNVHITTTDFMELQPIMTKEMVPGEKLNVNMESFARLNPLPVPTFGRARLINRAFYVPYRVIFKSWNDFIVDTVHTPSALNGSTSLVPSVPTVSNAAFVSAFIGDSYGPNIDITDPDAYEAAMTSDKMVFGVAYTAGDPVPAHDINNVASGGGAAYYDLTIKGRQALKVLESLGYKVVWTSTKVGDSDYYNATYSALPLLALAKIMIDYYWPTQYTFNVDYDLLASYCNKDDGNLTWQLDASQVREILKNCIYSYYSPDMFTAAWDKPNQPTYGVHSSNISLTNIDTFTQAYTKPGSTGYSLTDVKSEPYVTNRNDASGVAIDKRINGADAPFLVASGYGAASGSSTNYTFTGAISEYLLHGLHALTDYMRRHQLAGSRNLERYLSRFGKSLSVEKLNRCVYLGAHNQDIQIGDIMSTADTEGSNLGAYAGKGMSYGTGEFSFSTDEYGLFIIMSSLIPQVGYFQGIDRNVKHISKFDFFTPEFESVAVSALGSDELYVPQHYSGNYSTLPDQVFGYLPIYYEYKTKNDKVTGNFRVNSINGATPTTDVEFNAANSWYLMRMFDDDDYAAAHDIVHGISFIDGKNDMSQYKRIFYDVKASSPDNFTVIHNFNVASYSPMCSLFDTYEFEDKGKKVSVDVNGVPMN